MKQISITNGASFVAPEEAAVKLAERNEWKIEDAWEVIFLMMDDDLRQELDGELNPCPEIEFLLAYLERAEEDLIIG